MASSTPPAVPEDIEAQVSATDSTGEPAAPGPPSRPGWFRRHRALTTIVVGALVLFVAFSVYGKLSEKGGPNGPPDTIFIGPAILVNNRTDQEVEVWWFPAYPGPELLGTVAADGVGNRLVPFRQIPEGECSPWPVAFRWPDGSELLRVDQGELCTPAEVTVDQPHFVIYPSEEVADLEFVVLEVSDPERFYALLGDPAEREALMTELFDGNGLEDPGIWFFEGLHRASGSVGVGVRPELSDDPGCTANPIVVLRRDGAVHATLDAGWCGVLGDDDLELTAEGLRPHTSTTEE